MKRISKIVGGAALVGSLFALGACADQSQIDTLSARVSYLEGQMQATLQAAQAAEQNAALAREATDRMYRSGLRK